MSLVEIGDNFFSAQNRKNAKAIAFGFLRFLAEKFFCSKVTGIVRGDSNAPPDQSPRVTSSENQGYRQRNGMDFTAQREVNVPTPSELLIK